MPTQEWPAGLQMIQLVRSMHTSRPGVKVWLFCPRMYGYG